MTQLNNEKFTILFYFFMFLKVINKYPYRWNYIKNLYENKLLEQLKQRCSSNADDIKPLFDPITEKTYEPNTNKYLQINQQINEKKGIEQSILAQIVEEKQQTSIDSLKLELSSVRNEIDTLNKERAFSFTKYKLTATERKELEKINLEIPIVIKTFSNIFEHIHGKDIIVFKNMKNVIEKSINLTNSFEAKYNSSNDKQKQLLIDFTLFLTHQKQMNSYLNTISTIITQTIETIKQYENNQNISINETFENNITTSLKGNTEKNLVNVKKMIEILNIGFIEFINKNKANIDAYKLSILTLENMIFIINEFKNLN
jgi:hypothetical protein